MSGEPPVLTDAYAVFAQEAGPRIEEALKHHLPLARMPENRRFNEAVHDAIFPGGRRSRAALAMLACELVMGREDDALTAAVAVEYLHGSALIFDDLPAMDDAVERRGRLCLHARYGEGVAMTAALALMNASYRTVASRAPRDTACGGRAFREMTECVAAQIAGQADDLTSAADRTSGHPGESRARCWKTSALLRLSLTLGPILSGAGAGDVAALSRFGQGVGEAYQIADDCRDIDEDTALSQRGRDKTFAMEHGCESARRRAGDLAAGAMRGLIATFGDRPAVARLCEFAKFLC